ncbi:HAD-IA family hydrolase [Acaryochloris sp. IP29b_bin.148]|uniref:HAD-IA family hydrolase n=1 Tax=Acaryochloris sp. IP29b_bin.148 TaxID=2969218 RepID=UPI00261B210E|nr:HAD-IA family hydrolase [Acaryochloris sp. IP29b_bin.148]
MRLIVFDFDGTLADSLGIFIEATNRLAKDFRYEPLNSTQVELLRKLGIQEIAQELGIPKWRSLCYLQRFRQELTRSIDDLALVEGIDTALHSLKAEGYRLGIVTANSRRNVGHVLQKYKIDHLFEFIYGGQILSGKSRTLKRLARHNASHPKELIYIGDEINDVKAANQAALMSVAVSWGFNDRSVLAEQGPDYLLDNPEQILVSLTSQKLSMRSV